MRFPVRISEQSLHGAQRWWMAGLRFIVTKGFLLTLDSCEVSDHGQETNKEKCQFCALTSFSSLLAQPLLLAPKTTPADKLHHGGSSPFPRTEDDSLTYSRSYYCWKSSWRENQIIPWDNTFHLDLPGLMLHRKILHQEVLKLSLWNTIFSPVYFKKQLKILWLERRPSHLITSLTSLYQRTIMVTEKLDGSKSGFIFRFPDCACSCQKSLVQSLFKSTIKMSNGVNDLWISSKHCALILALGLAGDSLWEGCPVKRQFSQNWNFQGDKHPDLEPSFLSQ